MRTRCDHCRGGLGLVSHRCCRMRSCSKRCKADYIARLQEDTVKKILELHPPRGSPSTTN